MNRVGAVASIDTASRLATSVVSARISRGVKRELVPNTLTVVSIDNIDILQVHAMVSSTDATRSWHGVSTQCVQPLPESTTTSERSKRCRSSPVQSPVVTIKSKRRCRTLTEEQSPHAHLVMPTALPTSVSTCNTTGDNYILDDESSSTKELSLSDFKIDSIEEKTLSALNHNLFKCLLLMYCDSNRRCSILPQLSSMLHCMQPEQLTTETSNVVYLEIQSEKADDKATLLKLLARLHQTFIAELGQQHLIVVGDAKIFNVIHSIKEEYGDHFK